MANNMFTVELVGQEELIAKFVSMPAKLHEALVRKVYELEAMLEAKVKTGFLSGPTGAHTLSRRSGNLFRSVNSLPVQSSPTMVKGGVGYGADIPYAAAHEFGATIKIPEIVPVKAQALHFVLNGKDVFAKRVAAHTVTMPERAPLRTAFADMKQQIVTGLKQAAMGAIHE